jgi:hypothetical protein
MPGFGAPVVRGKKGIVENEVCWDKNDGVSTTVKSQIETVLRSVKSSTQHLSTSHILYFLFFKSKQLNHFCCTWKAIKSALSGTLKS